MAIVCHRCSGLTNDTCGDVLVNFSAFLSNSRGIWQLLASLVVFTGFWQFKMILETSGGVLILFSGFWLFFNIL